MLITNGLWGNPVNDRVRAYALHKRYPFIELTDVLRDPANTARGLFANQGVAAHPYNKEMREIKQRIWRYVGQYFK